MGKPTLRVIFDTNAFTPESFELLANSPFLGLCKAGRILPIYGHVFLEETFRAYGHANKREELVGKWIPFITSTADRFCKDFLTIWHEELVQGRGRKTNIFMHPRDQRRLIAALDRVPLDGSWRAFEASKQARNIEDGKRAAQREVSKEIRKEVADWRMATGYDPKRHGGADYGRFVASEIDSTGLGFIEAQVKCSNPIAVANRWARDKGTYPYFTTFVENMLYISYSAAAKPSDKIDLNAQADLDLMTHLLHADAVVSNETGFLRKSFDDLWRPKGKIILTSQEFAAFIAKL